MLARTLGRRARVEPSILGLGVPEEVQLANRRTGFVVVEGGNRVGSVHGI